MMERAIFQPRPMELRDRLLDMHIQDRISYDPEKNMLFLNYAGLHVRTQSDLDAIRQAVEHVLQPLGKRVYAVVNYERFVADDSIADAYMDLVKYVEENYYIKVSRYTTSGFLRVKLGKELGKRVLHHPHEKEQPFTRSLHNIKIAPETRFVYIEAHDNVHGWSKQRRKVQLDHVTGRGGVVASAPKKTSGKKKEPSKESGKSKQAEPDKEKSGSK